MVNDEEELGEALRRDLHARYGDIEPSAELVDRLHRIPGHRRRPPQRWLLAPIGAVAAVVAAVVVFAVSGTTPSPGLAIVIPGTPAVHLTVDDVQAVAPANALLSTLGDIRAVAMTDRCSASQAGVSYMVAREHSASRIWLAKPPAGSRLTVIVAAKRAGPNRVFLAVGTVRHVPRCVSWRAVASGLPAWMNATHR